MRRKTDWTLVVTLILAGSVGACQVGKAAIAIPLVRQDLGLSLAFAAWVVGAYGALGAVAGFAAGVGVSFVGAHRALVGGLVTIGVASVLGAIATTGPLLLATRFVEGCGFLAVVVAVPTLLRAAAARGDRELVMVGWSAYFPTGVSITMIAGPFLASFGWQALWFAHGAIAVVYAAVVWTLLRRAQRDEAAAPEPLTGLGFILHSPGPLLLAAAFAAYTFQYSALAGLLPTLLVERIGLSIVAAGAISAGAVVANAVGNLFAGILLRAGVPLWATVASAFAFAGIAAFGIFAENLPGVAVSVLAALSLGVTGLIPASIFAATPRVASSAHALAVTFGLVMQASNIGQLGGPAALGAWAQAFGWSRAPLLFVPVVVIGIAIALLLRRLLRPPS